MARLLVLMDYYLPGFRGGGPTTSVANLVEWLGKEAEFAIVARDRDLGDRRPYDGVRRGHWQEVQGAKVLYLRVGSFWLPPLLRLLRREQYDLLYLQGFFTFPTINALLLRRLRLVPDRPVVVAPRGDFSPAGLAMKRAKKRAYIWLARRLGLYRGVTWQVTAETERDEILASFFAGAEPVGARVFVAPNLPPRAARPGVTDLRPAKTPGAAMVVFLSRIARKKGLDLAIRALAQVAGEIVFDIYGPLEDPGYWAECQALIGALPRSVRASYRGAVRPQDVFRTFAAYHLFLFPSRGENFGHVVLEALTAGCPVLTGDATPWGELDRAGAGWALPPADTGGVARAVESVVTMGAEQFDALSCRAREFALRIGEDEDRVDASRRLLLGASPEPERSGPRCP